MADPFESALRDAVKNDEHKKSWKPDVGDVLIGEFLGTDRIPTDYGLQLVLRVRSEKDIRYGPNGAMTAVAGEVLTVWTTTVLRAELEKETPNPGDRVGITRLEDAQAKAGRAPAKRFVFQVDRSQPTRVIRPEPQAQQSVAQQPPQHPMGGPAISPATLAAYNRLAAHPLLTGEEKATYHGYTRHPAFTEEKAQAGMEKLHALISGREPPEDSELPF